MTKDWAAENFVGGHPALDFVNTAGGGTKVRDVERLLSYSDLLAWCEAAGLSHIGEVERLAQHASARPIAAQDMLSAALEFRESLHAVLIAKQAGAAIPEGDLRALEDAIRARLADACLVNSDGRLHWTAEPKQEPLLLPYVRIALAAQDLLTSDAILRVRNCERCSWLFLDRGRGKPRRWCSMAACGNRAKAARHYAREKQRAEKRA